MRLDSVRNAVNVSISIIAANVWIQCSTVSSELSVSFGRCQETEGREKSIRRQRDEEIGRWGDRETQ